MSLDLAPIDSAHQRCLETASSVMRKWVEDNFRRRGDRPKVKRWNFYLTRRRNAEGLKRLAVTVYADSNGPRWTYYRNFHPADCSKIYEYSHGWPTDSEDRIREFLMNKEAMLQRDLTPAEIRKAEERYAPGWLGEHCRAQVVAEVQSYMLEAARGAGFAGRRDDPRLRTARRQPAITSSRPSPWCRVSAASGTGRSCGRRIARSSSTRERFSASCDDPGARRLSADRSCATLRRIVTSVFSDFAVRAAI